MTTTTPGYPEPGDMLGPYRIERRLGFGGMGVVYAAFDASLDRSVALKVISPHLADDDSFRARFVREAQAQASVRSPHVVAVHSHGDAGGRLYIATELVDAGDLGKLVMEHGPPPMPTALDILAQVASGLADAHAAGLVHRDIKPANVLLRRREEGVQAYLADFGIARQVGVDPAYTQVGGTMGTPSYMAPELHTGGRAGIESDIYSLGCLLWAALVGNAPYAGTDYEVVTAHRESPVPQLRAGTPAADAVNQILLRSLAKRPTERYVGAGAMARDLREAARLAERSGERAVPGRGTRPFTPTPTQQSGGTPSTGVFANRHTPTPTPAPPRVVSPSPALPGYTGPRRRTVVAVAVVLLVLAAAVGAFLLLTGDDEPGGGDPGSAVTASEQPDGTTDPDAPTDPETPAETGDPAPPAGDVAPLDGEPTAEERQRLLDDMAAQLGDVSPLIEDDVAQCAAEGWLDAVGLETFLAEGLVSEDWRYLDKDPSELPASLTAAGEQAAITCAMAGIGG